ncbi:MAG: hypothetical protein HOH77_05470 [Candidatus Latescibacteria bacterium]|nr:hypothetical protein [Candidatus Latescibacterota bacterium]
MEFFLDKDHLIYWLIGLGCLLLPWWLLKLWRSLHLIVNTPPPTPPPKYHVHKVNPSIPFWLRGPILFTVGGLLTFLGFVCTIFFRNPQFLLLIIVGSLFLSGLFFYTYFLVFSTNQKSLDSHKNPGNLQVYTHPDWLFQNLPFVWFGLLNLIAGLVCAYIYEDIYLVLLSIYGLVFLLHLWSFSQLNVLTITDLYLHLHTGLPANGILTIPIHTIVEVEQSQPIYQRLLKVHTICIVDEDGAQLKIHTRLPHLFWTTLSDKMTKKNPEPIE